MFTIFLDKGAKRTSFSRDYKTPRIFIRTMKGYEKKGWKVSAYVDKIIIYETK